MPQDVNRNHHHHHLWGDPTIDKHISIQYEYEKDYKGQMLWVYDVIVRFIVFWSRVHYSCLMNILLQSDGWETTPNMAKILIIIVTLRQPMFWCPPPLQQTSPILAW